MYRNATRGRTNSTRHTLSVMRELVNRDRGNPQVVSRARELVRHLTDRDRAGEIAAVHNYVRDRVRYVHDPLGVETITTPTTLLEEIDATGTGVEDCDGHVVLEAALLEALGYPTRFKTMALDAARPHEASHVLLEVRSGGGWMMLDPINKQRGIGWAPEPLEGGGGLGGFGEFFGDMHTTTKWVTTAFLCWLGWKYFVTPLRRVTGG